MKLSARQSADRFEELLDRDIETLLDGGTPANTDLMPLRGIVEELRSLAHTPLSPGFVEFHATESAATAAERHSRVTARPEPRGGTGLLQALRRRATAAAATLVMLVSTTGMAWAADGAVPGDWYYGLDRALESIGIGAGGAAERLQELEATSPEAPDVAVPTQLPEPEDAPPEPGDTSTGLDRASTVVSRNQEENPTTEAELGPAERVLAYLQQTDHVDGAVISVLARGDRSQPDTPVDIPGAGRSDQAGERSNNASPENKGKPESPGKSGESESPGKSGKPDRP